MKTGVSVGDAMTLKPIVIAPTKTVQDCAKLMINKRVGSILVVEKSKLLGIITEKDIVRQIVAKHLNPNELSVKDIMVKRLKTIEPDKDLFEAMQFMKKHNVRKLPVLHEEKLQGLLTERDIVNIQPALLEIAQEQSLIRLNPKSEKYIEGKCDNCEEFAKLSDRDGEFWCEECIEQAT
jgi:CBS domain-containing protein